MSADTLKRAKAAQVHRQRIKNENADIVLRLYRLMLRSVCPTHEAVLSALESFSVKLMEDVIIDLSMQSQWMDWADVLTAAQGRKL